MATIRNRNGRWYCEVRKKGKRLSKTFDTKLDALNWSAEVESQIDRKKQINKTVGDALMKFRDEELPNKKGAKADTNRINKFLLNDTFCCININDLNGDDLQHWINDRAKSVSAASVRREYSLLRSVLNTARRKWRWFTAEPQKDIVLPKKPPPRDRRISQEEIDKILYQLEWKGDDHFYGTIRHELAIAFQFALETAMRWGEIWGLEWDRIYLNRRYLTLLDTKNGTKRDVPLSTKAIELLRIIDDGNKGQVFKSNPSSATTIFRRAVKEAQIENLRFHDTRHEALTRLARKIDVLDLARMVGHNDPRSLMIYYNATAEEIAGRLG